MVMNDAAILIADDNRDDIFFLRRAFAKAGLEQVNDVQNGQGVIDYLSGARTYADRERFPLPDLLVLDIKMPGKDGFDVLEWLGQRPALKEMPVVILTSSYEERDVQRARELGAQDYFVKSAKCHDLEKVADTIARRWLARHWLTVDA
jgi:CheY-like chemotaxis protein